MKKLTIGAIQTGLYLKDYRRAVLEGESFARKAASMGARLICFPEHWLIDKVLDPDDVVYEKFSNLARELDVYINLGGVYDRQDKSTFFVSPTISRRGEIISKQKKVHLFRREKRLAKGGNGFETFKIDGITAGVMVCHDVVFPESARTLVLKGAELLINPSLIIAKGIVPWKIYLMARVLENRVPIVAPNPYLYPRVPGQSVIFDLKYDKKFGIMEVVKLAEALEGKRIIIGTVDIGDDSFLRKERLDERKPRAYSFS